MRRFRVKRTGVVLAVVAMLAACGSDPAPTTQSDGTVSGEIFEGSISDDMLPLDTVQSQSPMLETAPVDAGSSDQPTADNGDNAEEPETAPEAEKSAPEE